MQWYALSGFANRRWYNKNQDGPLYILWGHRLYFPNYGVFISLKICFVLANNADPDEMPP